MKQNLAIATDWRIISLDARTKGRSEGLQQSMKAFLWEIAITVALSLILFLVLHNTIQQTIIDGSSMEPNFHDQERAFMNVAVYKYFHPPQLGDVVVLIPPIEPSKMYVKRVMGRPGDTVEIKNEQVYVNGTPLKEPYIARPPQYTMAPVKVPPDQYFVLGDNRLNSNDSHFGWFVARDKIVAKVWVVIWPPSSWGVVPSYDLGQQLRSSVLNTTLSPLAQPLAAAGN